MYQFIVRQKLRRVFTELSRGNYEYVLSQLAPEFEHFFLGNHPLGETRHTKEGFRRWCERMYKLTPDLNFEVINVVAGGTPWNTTVVGEWIDRATPADGEPYINRGVHVVRLRWGKITSIHAYFDTQIFGKMCERLAQKGVKEASAAPIID